VTQVQAPISGPVLPAGIGAESIRLTPQQSLNIGQNAAGNTFALPASILQHEPLITGTDALAFSAALRAQAPSVTVNVFGRSQTARAETIKVQTLSDATSKTGILAGKTKHLGEKTVYISALQGLENTLTVIKSRPGMTSVRLNSLWDSSRKSGMDETALSPAGIVGAGSAGTSNKKSISLKKPSLLRRVGTGLLKASIGTLAISLPAMAAPAAAASAISLGALGMAFAAGIMAFLSPCVLPLIPGYVSFISGLSRDELIAGVDKKTLFRRVGLNALCFVGGFTLTFTILGATATVLGSYLTMNLPYFTRIAGAFVTLFGLHTMEIIRIPWLYREKRYEGAIQPGLVGAFLMGLAFAFGWTPCVGPILSGILAMAASGETVVQGMLLLATFSMGLGIPFILTAFSVNGFLRFFQKYKRFIGWGERIAGAFLVILGILLMFNKLDALMAWIPEFFFRFAS
jgi:cytochrome c-type biogenesis protein